ncbi:MAG TPA: hypothetical protein VFE45_16905, partial [Coriobacteriia bacterium]|nr:hypothetical protein [Coriobacteriia bacterium]
MTTQAPSRPVTERTLDAHVRALSLKAAARRRVSGPTVAAAAVATIRALGPDYGVTPLTAFARRRTAAYFGAVLRAKALRDRRPEDREYVMLLK